jgi:hypothetical protein
MRTSQAYRCFIYLASPYTHPDPLVMKSRFETVAIVTARLLAEGEVVFSPICHCHPIKDLASLPHTWDFWEPYDRAFLSVAKALYVLKLPGWKESVGVQAEIRIAKEMGIPIKYISPTRKYVRKTKALVPQPV